MTELNYSNLPRGILVSRRDLWIVDKIGYFFMTNDFLYFLKIKILCSLLIHAVVFVNLERETILTCIFTDLNPVEATQLHKQRQFQVVSKIEYCEYISMIVKYKSCIYIFCWLLKYP